MNIKTQNSKTKLTIQLQKRKLKKRHKKIIHKTQYRKLSNTNPLNIGSDLRCSGRVMLHYIVKCEVLDFDQMEFLIDI